MRQEIEIWTKYTQKESKLYKLNINYNQITENADVTQLKSSITQWKQKIKSNQLQSQLMINLAKNGILCQGESETLQQIIKGVYDQNDQCKLVLIIDVKNMLETGGIHYYLSKQLDVINNFLRVTTISISLTQELFNSQCLSTLSNSIKAFVNIKVFTFKSSIKLDQMQLLSSLPLCLSKLKLYLIDPNLPQIFQIIEKQKNLNYLSLTLLNCEPDSQKELNVFLNKTQISKLSLGLSFKQSFLLSKETFYNSLSECIKLINNRKIQLKSYQLDLSQIEDSGIKQNLIEELSTGISSQSIEKINLTFTFEQYLKTILISFLYKLSNLIQKLSKLKSLRLQMNIPLKYLDILQKSLNQNLWRLQEFSFIDTYPKNELLEVRVENEENCKISKIEGLRVLNSKKKLRSLTFCNENVSINLQNKKPQIQDKIGIKEYIVRRKMLLYYLYSIKISQLLKRKEMIETLLIDFLI